MNKAKNDLELALVLTTFFALLVFWIVPVGVVVPTSHASGQLSPAAYPTWICVTGLIISIIMTINAFRAVSKQKKIATKTKKLPFEISDYFALVMAFALLFAFYFSMETIGMIVGSFLLYAVFAVLCGEKNWKRLLIVDTLLMIIMYVFFVNIAAVPVPLGILSSIL